MTNGFKNLSITNKKNLKMKGKAVLSVMLFAITTSTFAQKEECQQNLSIFSEFAKVKNYKDAYTPWKAVYDKCPELHYATFFYGERILKDKIANVPAEKAKYIKDLQELYAKYNQYFPQRFNATDKAIKEALLMIDEKVGNKEDVLNILDKAFKANKNDFSDETAIYQYFAITVDLYNEGKKQLQDVFDNYDDVSERIQDEKEKLSKEINMLIPKEEAKTLSQKETRELSTARTRVNNLENITESIDAKLGQLANCDKLVPLYEKNFDANKDNAVWLRRAAGKMSDKNCTSDPMFVKLVENLYKLEPSASAAYYLGVLSEQQKKTAEAVKYFNQSVDLETDNLKKSNILVKIATKYSGSAAVNYAQKALTYNPSNSNAYQIMAAAYASAANECGSTTFEKRAIYWLAANVARKGGLESLANRYEKLAPSKADIFSSGMAGKTITFKCWVGQSVKVPSL